ncbi:MAG: hypothetical protein JWO40_284 [Candidatus Doudnabacteria bacterium]|nr:hypothetical protein [Candidatus Doudnabacteria bacterium]
MRNKKIAPGNKQLGQTLIETLVAIFILITGLISAITLAIYSFNSTDNSSKQIVATALAGQGLEAIKNIRDNNWLDLTNDPLVSCPDLGSTQMCYSNWQGQGSNKLVTGDYTVDFLTLGNSPVWRTQRQNSNANFTLKYDSTDGQYANQGAGVLSVYSRDINIVEETAAPYTALNPRLRVTSTVWWSGKSCAVTTDPTTLPATCKVVLQTYLTNWKNY